jgi:hypothetical protein
MGWHAKSVKLLRDPNERALAQTGLPTHGARSLNDLPNAGGGSVPGAHSSWASGLWDGWRAKCETGWQLALKPAAVSSVLRIEDRISSYSCDSKKNCQCPIDRDKSVLMQSADGRANLVKGDRLRLP